MDFGAFGENFPLVAAILGLILIQFFLRRRRRTERTSREIVQNLLAETRLNVALVELWRRQQKSKKFLTTSWQRNKNRLDFLAQPLQVALTDAYMMAEDFNRQIAMMKKQKSASYLPSLDADKLSKLLAVSQQGLEAWFQTKVGTKNPPLKYPTISDFFFGGRDD